MLNFIHSYLLKGIPFTIFHIPLAWSFPPLYWIIPIDIKTHGQHFPSLKYPAMTHIILQLPPLFCSTLQKKSLKPLFIFSDSPLSLFFSFFLKPYPITPTTSYYLSNTAFVKISNLSMLPYFAHLQH